MQLIGLARLGRDAVLRHLPDGTPVLNVALAFNYGKKDADNKRPTQWVDAAMFGDRAERVAPHFLKGALLNVFLSDPHFETYPKNGGGEGTKLVARFETFEFAGSAPQPAAQQNAGGQSYAQATGRPAPAANKPAPRSDFSDMDDEIPF